MARLDVKWLLMKQSAQQRVIVAMSGGVDSSVAAAILLDAGYQVEGVMLQLWSDMTFNADVDTKTLCNTQNQFSLAARVADKLGIPFKVIDVAALFRSIVIQDLIDGYLTGNTPNPCIVCNQRIKFGFLLDQVFAGGADFLATGHYVRLSGNGSGYQLLRGSDASKDQSYVLYTLNQQHLRRLLFPIGGYSKTEIRKKAAEFGLPILNQPESQDICFLPDGDYRQFLRRVAPTAMKPGPILDLDGNVMGEHNGLPGYTIGQRKGLGISGSEPYYVQQIDTERNSLIVGPKNSFVKNHFYIKKLNWVAGQPPTEDDVYDTYVKIRYRSQPIKATIHLLPNGWGKILLALSLYDITPGQSAVFYKGDICLGGGVITFLERDA